jgi:cytochrome P450
MAAQVGGEIARREPGSRELPASAIGALREMESYLEEVLEAKHKRPADDLLSAIARGCLGGDALGERSMGLALLLMVASMKTSASLIANGLLLLAEYPDQRRWLRQHLDHVAPALEEILRFESPVQHLKRTTTTDVDLHGMHVPRGSEVLILYGSANRDERQFIDGERFDIGRVPKRNLAFGNGIHHCLGAPLARLEGKLALQVILTEAPDYEIVGPVQRLESHMDRGIERLPVILS